MKTTIVVPLYNENKHIDKVLKDIEKFKKDIVVVDDGSRDNSGIVAKASGVTVLTHVINLGKGAAMKTGADFAFGNGADAVVFMDADGQHDPHDLELFIQKLESLKYDVIFGSRSLADKAPFVRFWGNKIASMVIDIFFGIKISDPICGYRAITKTAYKKMRWESSGYAIESEMLARVAQQKLRYIEIPVRTIYHDKDKGVTMLDAFGVFGNVIKWWLSP